MFMRFFVVIFACLPFLACGSHGTKHASPKPNNNPPAQDPPPPSAPPPSNPTPSAGDQAPWKPKPNASLVFSAIDPMAMPWQASVYRLDLSSKVIERLLTGESGDPALFTSGDEVLFFNRYFDSQNYRRLTPKPERLTVSAQQKFAGGEIGDPHDALYLGNDRVLLAHYTQGRLVVMQQSTGAEIASVDADWDLPSGVSLKPEALVPIEKDGKRLIYVVHQALSVQDGLVLANGTQQIFVLEDSGSTLKAVDLDPNQPKVQGIKIKGSFPIPVRFQRRDKILLVSMCSRLVLASTDDPAKKCQNAVEELDPSTNTVSTAWDLNDSGLFMNGPVAPGPNSDTFFASVDQKLGSEKFEKRVVKINIKDHSASTIYTFMPDSGGFWASLYDEASKVLYIGDIGSGSIGKLVILPEDGIKSEMALAGVPYSGTFIPSPAR